MAALTINHDYAGDERTNLGAPRLRCAPPRPRAAREGARTPAHLDGRLTRDIPVYQWRLAGPRNDSAAGLTMSGRSRWTLWPAPSTVIASVAGRSVRNLLAMIPSKGALSVPLKNSTGGRRSLISASVTLRLSNPRAWGPTIGAEVARIARAWPAFSRPACSTSRRQLTP
jgi:hypothetical protein